MSLKEKCWNKIDIINFEGSEDEEWIEYKNVVLAVQELKEFYEKVIQNYEKTKSKEDSRMRYFRRNNIAKTTRKYRACKRMLIKRRAQLQTARHLQKKFVEVFGK